MLSISQPTPSIQDTLLESLRGKFLIVYAGTLEPYQGIDILIRAFRYVTDEVSQAFLLIVGGTQEQVEYYSDLATECQISQFCYFTGRVPQALAKYYADHAHIQVSPRISGTNTPLKVYEQLARGIPLVATNIYSHTQVLTQDVAFLVRPEPLDLARGILTALEDKTEAQHRAANAQTLYEQNYSRRIYTEKMKQVFALIGRDGRQEAGIRNEE